MTIIVTTTYFVGGEELNSSIAGNLAFPVNMGNAASTAAVSDHSEDSGNLEKNIFVLHNCLREADH